MEIVVARWRFVSKSLVLPAWPRRLELEKPTSTVLQYFSFFHVECAAAVASEPYGAMSFLSKKKRHREPSMSIDLSRRFEGSCW